VLVILTTEHDINLYLRYWISRRNHVSVRSGVSHNLLSLSTTQRQCQRSQVASQSAFTTNRRLTPVLTDQDERLCRVLYQPKKQIWTDFLLPSGIKVSSYNISINACILMAMCSIFKLCTWPLHLVLNEGEISTLFSGNPLWGGRRRCQWITYLL